MAAPVMDMGPDSIEQFVVTTVAELAHRSNEEIARQTRLFHLGIDSLMITTLGAFIEARYMRSLPPEEVTALYEAACIDDVLIAVGRILAEGAPASAVQEGRTQ